VETNNQRYFIELAFNGTAYHGWQVQQNAISVQEVLNKQLGVLFRKPMETVGCGRTDAGVHARQLYAHFDDEGGFIKGKEARLLGSLNALLPSDIAVKRIFAVENQAHARFDAIRRSYEYHLHFKKDPFLEGLSWQVREIPDVDLMNEAAVWMMDYTDFSCFSKSHTQVHTNNCKITHAEWKWLSADQLVFYISADRFLRNMVRAIVGTLLEIGNGKQPASYIHTVIASKNRSMAGTSVPACGLYLTEVRYPWDSLNTEGL